MKIPKSKIELAASQEQSRYTLQAVKIDVERKRVMATDGHILAIVPLEQVSPEDHSTLISLETVKNIRAMQKRAKFPVKVSTNGKVVAECLGERLEAEPVNGTFPNADAVIPKFEGPPTISFDVNLLKRLSAALHSDTSKGRPQHVSLWIKDGQSPILVKSTSEEDKQAIGVLMPVRAWKAERP